MSPEQVRQNLRRIQAARESIQRALADIEAIGDPDLWEAADADLGDVVINYRKGMANKTAPATMVLKPCVACGEDVCCELSTPAMDVICFDCLQYEDSLSAKSNLVLDRLESGKVNLSPAQIDRIAWEAAMATAFEIPDEALPTLDLRGTE